MAQECGGTARNNADYSDLDHAERPEDFVEEQDQLNRLGDITAYKRRMQDLLDPQPGDHLLDAGCGAGADVLALATLVGPTGRVVGVDRSATMVRHARARAAGCGLPVTFLTGDVTHLAFPDTTFAGCRADRVLHHLDDPARALAELARVTRPGGRVVVCEPDLETMIYAHPDHAVSRRLADFFADTGARNGRVARHLYALFGRQGLAAVTVEISSPVMLGWDVARAIGTEDLLARAQEAGVLSAVEVAHWIAEAREADRAGVFLTTCACFLVSGRKT